MAYGFDVSNVANNVAVDKGTSIGDVQLFKMLVGSTGSVVPIPSDATFGLAVDVTRVSGTVVTLPVRPFTGTRTSVAASSTSVTLLAANGQRKDAAIYNDSAAYLYVALGTTAASTTSFTVKLSPGGIYEPSYGYTGQINGIWDTATGSARVTELTA